MASLFSKNNLITNYGKHITELGRTNGRVQQAIERTRNGDIRRAIEGDYEKQGLGLLHADKFWKTATGEVLENIKQRGIFESVQRNVERVRHIGFGKEDGLTTYEGYRSEGRASTIPKEQKVHEELPTDVTPPLL